MEAAPQDTLHRVGDRLLMVDNTRFWCMAAVVCLHCTRVWTLTGPDNNTAWLWAATICKFGTIGFFLVSGFLLEESLRGRSSLDLIKKRIEKVAAPWLVWFVFSFGIFFLDDRLQHRGPFHAGGTFGGEGYYELARMLTATSLWFVPNLFLCLAVLLVFRRWVHRVELGAALLAVNLFYVANIYRQWTVALHSEALFGFVFFLWLGHFAGLHRKAFNRWLTQLWWPFLVAATLLAGVAAFLEAGMLLRRGTIDPLNTLRLSNQVFSLLVVLCLAKLPRPTWPRFVDVPRHTFGIYLSHSVIVALVLTCARRLVDTAAGPVIAAHLGLRLSFWVGLTVSAWGVGLMCARLLAASKRLEWLVGLGRLPGWRKAVPRPAGKGHEVELALARVVMNVPLQ